MILRISLTNKKGSGQVDSNTEETQIRREFLNAVPSHI